MRVVRGRVGIYGLACVAMSASAACFRGDFLDNTCERLPGGCQDTAAESSSSGSATTDAPAPDMGAPACAPEPQEPAFEPPPGGVLEEGPAFRISKVQFVDPNFYYPLGQTCIEVSGTVGDALTDSLAKWETNLLFLGREYDPDADEQALFFVRDATCDQNANYCAYGSATAGFPISVQNYDDDGCGVEVAPNSADAEDIMTLGDPSPPCFRSPQASFEVALIPNAAPLKLYFARFAARYEPDDCNPDRLVQGVMTGFVKREDAIAAEYYIDNLGVTVNLWQAIYGSDTNDCEMAIPRRTDVDAVFFPDPAAPGKLVLTYGVYLYLNIEAQRLPVYRVD